MIIMDKHRLLESNIEKNWILNVRLNDDFENEFQMMVFYIVLPISGCMFIHSNYIYYRRRYNFVRILSECGALALIIASTLLIFDDRNNHNYDNDINGKKPSTDFVEKKDLIIYVLYGGLLTLLIQLSDNYMFFKRLSAVTRMNMKIRILLYSYICIFLVSSWVSVYVILPFFYDIDSQDYKYWNYIGTSIRAWGHVIYNCTLSFYFRKRVLRKGPGTGKDMSNMLICGYVYTNMYIVYR